MFQSSNGSSLENEYIVHNQLNKFVLDGGKQFQTMNTFPKAVSPVNFQNGHAKAYCKKLSHLCANTSTSLTSGATTTSTGHL